MHVTIKI